MSILEKFQQGVQFVLGGVRKIFSPRDDQYPETGVQPYDGDPAEHQD